jgi:hypothetical protein
VIDETPPAGDPMVNESRGHVLKGDRVNRFSLDQQAGVDAALERALT